MSKSIKRVRKAAEQAGIATDIRCMGESTRTAQEAARQCGCDVAQIVKSLVFQGKDSGRLYLFLVSGANTLDAVKAQALCREALERADPRKVRDVTGFAIGGVAPIGHLEAIACWADETLMAHKEVWAAAGAPDAVFRAEPAALMAAAGAAIADIAS